VGALLASGSKVNGARAEDGATPLHVAAEEGFLREVATLLAVGADRDAR
jgi:ankyrin repeat protein